MKSSKLKVIPAMTFFLEKTLIVGGKLKNLKQIYNEDEYF